MCGVVGFVGLGRPPQEYPSLLRGMLRGVRHRGQDHSDLCFDADAGLATARLAIVDREGGRQPMASRDGRYWIVFNGEIFNHLELRQKLARQGAAFATECDTEVLLYALLLWGPRALTRINGQYALAFYDRAERSLLLARDPFGERPLFYTLATGGLAFASEIKALFALPFVERRLSPQGLREVCHFWGSLPGSTCFERVHAVPAAHYLVYSHGRLRQHAHEVMSSRAGQEAVPFPEACRRVRETVTAAVRRRLCGRAPVAVYLSGGVDSAIVAAVARRESGGAVHSFSIEFDGPALDESAYQAQMVAALGLPHHPLRVGGREIAAVLPRVVWHAESPLFRTAPAPLFLLAKQVYGQGLKVSLSAEGADEMFLGYDHFRQAAERGFGAPFPSRPHRERFDAEIFATDLIRGPAYDPRESERRLAEALRRIAPDFDERSPLERAQAADVLTLLSGYLLSSQGDRMAAAHSVETRCPFLDPEVVRLACALPEAYRLSPQDIEKHVLRQAFVEEVPAPVRKRPKQPYRAPALAWLEEDDELTAEWLGPRRLAASAAIDGERARRLLAEARSGARLPGRRYDHAVTFLVTALLLEDAFIHRFELPPGDVGDAGDSETSLTAPPSGA